MGSAYCELAKSKGHLAAIPSNLDEDCSELREVLCDFDFQPSIVKSLAKTRVHSRLMDAKRWTFNILLLKNLLGDKYAGRRWIDILCIGLKRLTGNQGPVGVLA